MERFHTWERVDKLLVEVRRMMTMTAQDRQLNYGTEGPKLILDMLEETLGRLREDED